jgi:hypothetical protein
VALNLTAVAPTDSGDFRLFPAGHPLPLASAINFTASRTRASNVIVPVGVGGQVSVYCDMPIASGSTNLVVDVYGFFKR